MGDEGVCAILATLGSASNSKLEELALEQNEIGEEGATALVNANLPNLVMLRLAENEDMPKDDLKNRFGKVVDFGDDDDDSNDDDQVNGEDDEQVDDLVATLAASHL